MILQLITMLNQQNLSNNDLCKAQENIKQVIMEYLNADSFPSMTQLRHNPNNNKFNNKKIITIQIKSISNKPVFPTPWMLVNNQIKTNLIHFNNSRTRNRFLVDNCQKILIVKQVMIKIKMRVLLTKQTHQIDSLVMLQQMFLLKIVLKDQKLQSKILSVLICRWLKTQKIP